jgi:amino acid adenylation domain-containing protein
MTRLIHEIFETTASSFPDKIAVRSGESAFTYADLRRRMDEVAYACLQAEPSDRSVVMVLLPKGYEVIYTLLGVFRSGKVYLPVSWKLGATTWQKILVDIKPTILITCTAELERVSKMLSGMDQSIKHILLVDKMTPVTDPVLLRNAPLINPMDTAYLYLTSGTTGIPKVVEGIHESLTHFIQWQVAELTYGPDSSVSQLASLTFDASLKDILPTLISGGTLCIPSEDILSNTAILLQWIIDSRITIMATVPSVFRILLNEIESASPDFPSCRHLRYLLLAGEPLYNKDIDRWRQAMGTDTEVINLYGTTESTILKTFYRIGQLTGGPADAVSVGKPIPDATVLIVNDDGLACQTQEEGHVYIKCRFFSRGYFRDEQATKEIFIPNPLTGIPGDTVYKTGDLGRYMEDGNILIMGRRDSQVKIRGVRINLSSIERIILGHTGIKQVKCLIRSHAEEQYLVCYYTADRAYAEDEIRAFCRQWLSDYELPDHLIAMPAFPVNGHGKIDTTALPDPLRSTAPRSEETSTAAATAQLLVDICKALFKRTDITPEDNFFQIGGNSLKAILFGGMIKKRSGLEVGIAGLQQLFNRPVLHEFAAYLDEMRASKDQDKKKNASEIAPAAARPAYPLSYAQEQIWLACQKGQHTIAYNMTQTWSLNGILDISMLQGSIHRIIERHEILRTRFVEEHGQISQQICPAEDTGPTFIFHDLSAEPDPSRRADELIAHNMNAPFDLSLPGLFRIMLVMTRDKEFALNICMHHIIGDSWSAAVLSRELGECYTCLMKGLPWHPEPLPLQYKDYAMHEREQLRGEPLQTLKQFWLDHLGPRIPQLHFKTDTPRTPDRTMNGARYEFVIPGNLPSELHSLAAANSVSVFSLLLSAYYLTFYKYSADEDIVIGIPVNTRNSSQMTELVGLYVNTLVLKTRIDPGEQLSHFLTTVYKNLIAAFVHQAYPFQEIARHYTRQVDSQQPIFDMAMNMLSSAPEAIFSASDNIVVSDRDSSHRWSKFNITLYVYDNLLQEPACFIEYNNDLYKEKSISRFTDRYLSLLTRLAKPGQTTIGELLKERPSIPALR